MSDEKAKFEMPFDTEEKLLDAMNRTKNDLKLSKEEETRLTKAFKEPEFKKCIFPLENLMKSDVRKIAKEIGLSVSSKNHLLPNSRIDVTSTFL